MASVKIENIRRRVAMFGDVETGPSCSFNTATPTRPPRISYPAIGVNFTATPLSLVASKPSLARFVTT